MDRSIPRRRGPAPFEGSPVSIGSPGSRDHAFHAPKCIRRSRIAREPDPEGDRVHVVPSGKFLPSETY